ncbi:glycoside hydrolase family 18 protein [Streptomyces sp. NPDC047917]|uniref:glycoside hydrolase family 18 protein n=1 Tax=Streptomyces sp. NPDC047917 TaxID=3365491 RepID=UPI003710D588
MGTPEYVGYFPAWGIYGRKFHIKDLHDNGTAECLTILNYAFENISSDTKYNPGFKCFESIKLNTAESDNNADGSKDAGDAWADYLCAFGPGENLDGVQQQAEAKTLMGNFYQLKKLKEKHPNLKVLVSLGGWTYSRNWSEAAKTDDTRKALVSSCIDLFIKGNLPTKIFDKTEMKDHFGGAGVAAGIFDGVDLDWEWPACDLGLHGNHFDSKNDKANLVALLKEFRTQLDALDQKQARGGKYLLTMFLPAGPDVLTAGWDVDGVMQYLDYGNLQGYDYHGPFGGSENKTNHQSQYADSAANALSVERALAPWIAKAEHKKKILFGIPFYSRGWEKVKDDPQHPDGLGCEATAAVRTTKKDKDGIPVSEDVSGNPWKAKWQAGVNDYRDVAGLTSHGFTRHWDANALVAYLYGEVTDTLTQDKMKVFWTLDDCQAAYEKAKKAMELGIAGVMAYSLDGDVTKTGDLSRSIRAGLDGKDNPVGE